MSSTVEIAIIGAGFSGTLVAAHLLRRASASLTIHLIERSRRQFARGVAYGTDIDCHLLNVPAGNMSAYPDDPDHFLRWAIARQADLLDPPWITEINAGTFLPRRAYGEYLNDVLDEAERSAGPGVRLRRWVDEAVGLDPDGRGATVRLAGGQALPVDRVVLALGNFPPGNLAVADPSFYDSPRYHANPWAAGVLEAVLNSRSCLLIGSGLTMVDWAVTLDQAGYEGQIHVISRRGLWPTAHRATSAVPFTIDAGKEPVRVRDWLRQIRRYLRATGGDWRAVIDALRPSNPRLWGRLPPTEQRRFLRHLRPFWDCHRHRLAPPVAERLDALKASGRLVRHVGRLRGYRDGIQGVEVSIGRRGSATLESFSVDAVVNCSGSESNYRKLDNPLVGDLLGRRLIQSDDLSLGLKVGPDGALIGADGAASGVLYTLGPPQKGLLWETTAVPEIRGQAARLAASLLAEG